LNEKFELETEVEEINLGRQFAGITAGVNQMEIIFVTYWGLMKSRAGCVIFAGCVLNKVQRILD
jgi:hypothetical protein